MIGIALRTLRFHKGGFAASFVALFLGAALVIGSGGLLETGVRLAAPPERLAAAPLVVTDDQRYAGTAADVVFPGRVRTDAALVDEVAAVPGVAAALPDVSFPVLLPAEDRTAATEGTDGTDGLEATGHGWSVARLAPLRLAEGARPTGDGAVVVGDALAARAGLRPGDRLGLVAGGVRHTYTVSGLASGPGAAAGVLFTDAEAARLAGHPGTVDAIGVLTAPGADVGAVADALRDRLAGRGVTVLDGDARGRAEDPAVLAEGEDLVPLAAAFGGLAALVTVFAVAGAVSLSLRRRRQDMALLRAIGATPRQVRRMILVETSVLAVFATALACVPGPRVGEWLLATFADNGVVPASIAYRSGAVPLIAGAGTALLTALCAAFLAARAAGRTRPVEALADVTADRARFGVVRLIAALACLGGGTALAVVTARTPGPDADSVATPAALLWTSGFGLLGPVLSRAFTAVLRRPMRAAGGLAGDLATLNARAGAARTANAVMPVMLATGLALSLVYLHTTQAAGAREAFDASLRADLVVTAGAGGLPLDTVGAVAALPGVGAASAQISGLGWIEPDEPLAASRGGESGEEGEDAGPQPTEVALRGVTAGAVEATTAFRAVDGDLGALRGDTVALPRALAEGRRLGDAVPMRLGDGSRVTPVLVATVDGRRGYETALLPADLLAAHTDTGLVPQILVTAAPGADTGALAASLAALATDHPGLQVADRDALGAARAEQDRTQASMAYLVVVMVVGYAAIALVNAQILATGERRRELALHRLVGATRRQVTRMMTCEAILTAVSGTALGALTAACVLVPASLGIADSPLPTGSPLILLTVTATAVTLTVATTLLTTRAALRTPPGRVVAGLSRAG
ncbi:ABC transporter permease [Streptomyces avicenniae]|uniref:ABC transporter permease n=1 Tax=Streptomyces avicenniae TaxID=500153 RepID=UPI000A667363|nr:ABC transporter permease [Streptomyces avicenniae]